MINLHFICFTRILTSCIDNHPAGAAAPIDTDFGALFHSENMACTDSGYPNNEVGDTFNIRMMVNLYDVVGTQTLFCKYGVINNTNT